MEFTIETFYDQKAAAAMARILRKTIRKKHSRRAHLFGWIVVVLALLLSLPLGEGASIDGGDVITWLVVLVLLAVLIWEDAINGWVARKRMLPGTSVSTCVFREEDYQSVTEMGETTWKYENILLIAETRDYFAFLFDQSHVQVYDKGNIAGGTVEEFRAFLTRRTEKEIQTVT